MHLHVDVVGSVNNKARTLGMEHVKGRKFTEKKKDKVEVIQLANLASASQAKIKALLGMLARLPWGRRNMLGSDGWKTRRSVC